MKRAARLLFGIVLLLIGTFFLLEFAQGLRHRWQRELSAAAHAARSAKSDSAIDKLVPGAGDVKVYGVLAEADVQEKDAKDEPPPPIAPPSSFDHVSASPSAATQLLHRRLTVKNYQAFEFVVPPHVLHPRLRGIFRSVAGAHSGGRSTVGIMLMNNEEFAHFVRNEPAESVFSAEPSSQGEIDWWLSATCLTPQKYHLVFQNPFERQNLSVADVDFTVSFE